jgi:hypothetical protein
MTKDEALDLALEALEIMTQPVKTNDETTKYKAVKKAITALREALAEQPAQKRPQNCGTSYCSCIECVMEPAQQEPPCKTGGQCTSKCQQCAVPEPVARYCCHSCFKACGGVMLDRMILCSECGNKRCPKASDHRLDCTSSNDLGQPGSVYTTPPAQPALVEPLEYWNAVEGWVKIDEVREHFDSVGCGTIYKTAGDGRVPLTAAQRQWVGLTDEERKFVRNSVGYNQFVTAGEYAEHVQKATEAKLKERNV